MRNWRDWGLKEWNDRLLEHFFSTKGPGGFTPVSTLLVTAEELLRAVGEIDFGLIGEVRHAFVRAVLDGTPDERELFDFASDDDPRVSFNPTIAAHRPPTFVYLVFSCLAAAESSEDLDGESSYRERLQKLSNNRCSGRTLKFLPCLWERFRDWLALRDNRRDFRQLILPPPNAHSLIGYSERLAFPHRKDQRTLARLLQQDRLMGVVPPPGPVVSVVAKNADLFSKEFQAVFREFQELFFAAVDLPRIRHHQFWSAVVDAALRGREEDNESDAVSNRIDLVVSFDGEQLQLYLFSRDASRPPSGTTARPLEYQVADWRIGYSDAETNSFHRGAERALQGGIRLGRIADGVSVGLLPLVPAWSDYMIVVDDPEVLPVAKMALVRHDQIQEAIRVFGGRSSDCATTDGTWVVVEQMDFRRQPPSEHTFRRLRSMQKRLPVPRVFLVGGIPCDDGYLGFAEILPSIRAIASRVTMSSGGAVHECLRIDTDRWALPRANINGQVTISSWEGNDLLASSTFRFVSHANCENYKEPTAPEALLTESVRGCVEWMATPAFAAVDENDDLGEKTGGVIYLGRAVGEFVRSPSEAAWIVTRKGGGAYRLTIPDSPDAGLPPIQKTSNKGDCRMWSQMLTRAEPDFAESDLQEKKKAVCRLLANRTALHVIPPSAPANSPSHYDRRSPARAVEIPSFIASVAARASGRAGLPFSEWRELATVLLGLNRRVPGVANDSVDALTRCWLEAGLIDVGISVRWRSRSIFAAKPKIVLFRSGTSIHGTVVGLALPFTITAMREEAVRAGAVVEEKHSPCRFVPTTFTFISEDLAVFEHVARKHRVPYLWLRRSVTGEKAWREQGRQFPENYELRRRSDRWSLSGESTPTAPLLTHARDDSPTAWSVDGAPMRWSFDRNIARLHACVHAGLDPFVAKGCFEIEARHSYLPLPIARIAAVTGPILPGPETTEHGGRGHIYAFGTSGFRDEMLHISKSL